jgi:hypothetical protein
MIGPMTENAPGSSITRQGDVAADLQQFEEILLTQLAAAGLPTEGVVAVVEQRRRVLVNLGAALADLPAEKRPTAYYLSKMIAAVEVGLFDAALNYVWDETVSELRRRVAGYDLAYFFDIAVPSPDRRKSLSSEQDLQRVDDIDLLRAAREIGLISSVGHAQLDHIRYMRNYASAAHPNEVELTGLQLAEWLETCIREVINLPYDPVTAEIGRLLRNVKQARLSRGEIDETAAFFDRLPGDRPDALAAGLFGLYTDPSSTPETVDNVRALWRELWRHVSEDARHGFGTKYARYVANADRTQAQAAGELLEIVSGQAYLPEPIRVARLADILDTLIAAHRGYNNFYNEPSPARALEAFVGDREGVPKSIHAQYTSTLVDVFLSNGHGVANAADPIYRRLLERLDSEQAALALRAIRHSTIAIKLRYELCQKQWVALLEILEPKLARRSDRELLEAIRSYEGPLNRLPHAKSVQALLEPQRTATPN